MANVRGNNSGGILDTVYGSPQPLGIIVATTTKNNHDTATAFNNTGAALKGMTLLVQPDAACYIKAGTTNAATVTASTVATMGILLAANEKAVITMKSNEGWLACLSVSGTTNLRVWQMV